MIDSENKYIALLNALRDLKEEAKSKGKNKIAEKLEHAINLYGGMRTEFLGEAWLALMDFLDDRSVFTYDSILLAEDQANLIKLAFAEIGQELRRPND